jgi:hypothetical protein
MYEHLEVRQRLTAGWAILIALTDAFGDAITPSVTRAWRLLGFRGQQAGFPLSEDHADLATALRVKRYRWSAAIARRRAAFATGAAKRFFLMMAMQWDKLADFGEDQLDPRRSWTLRHVLTHAIKRGIAQAAIHSYGVDEARSYLRRVSKSLASVTTRWLART